MTVRPTPRPRPPANLTRRSVYWIVVSNEFEQLILVAIVVNTIALAAPYQGMPPSYSSGLEYLNDGLAVIFTLEMIAKVYAFGARAYFADPWGRFDAVVVIFSDLGILLSVLGGLSVGAIGTLARVLRLGRVVRLAKALKSLRQMVSTLILVMPQLFNVGLLVLLMIFIYAIAGVQLFASVGWDGQYLVAQSNFQNVGRGMLMASRPTCAVNICALITSLLLLLLSPAALSLGNRRELEHAGKTLHGVTSNSNSYKGAAFVDVHACWSDVCFSQLFSL